MSQPTPTWLDRLLNKLISVAGVAQPPRGTVDFQSGFTSTDDPTNDTLHLTAVGTAGLPGQMNLTLANGSNENVDPASKTVLHISGPTGAFSIGGFVAPSAPVTLVVVNTTSQPLTLNHEDVGSTAANRIDTQAGVAVTLPPRKSKATFTYDTTAQRWVLHDIGLRMPFELNVRDFGAKGDGTTDDTAAIQNALSAAAALPGAEIWFPAGIYVQSRQLSVTSGVKVRGARALYDPTHVKMLGSWLKWAGGPALTVNAASNASPIVLGVASSGTLQTGDTVTVSGVGGNTAANGTWKVTVSGSNITLLGTTGNGSYTTGGTVAQTQLDIFDTSFITVQNLGLWGNGTTGIVGMTMHSDNSPASFENTFLRMTFAEHDKGFVWGNTGSFGPQTDAQNDTSVLDQCNFEQFHTYGIDIESANAADNSVIRGCRFNSLGAIDINLNRCGVDLIIDHCAAGGSSAFLLINAGGVDSILVRGCENEAPQPYFVTITGANDAARYIFEGNAILTPCTIGAAVVIGLGNLITQPIELQGSGRWLEFGGRFQAVASAKGTTSGFDARITEDTGTSIFANVSLINAAFGGEYANRGHITVRPAWNLPTGIGGVAAEMCVRSGYRTTPWAATTAYNVGDTVIAIPDNGHAFVVGPGHSGTSGGSQPSWNTGSGATTTDGGVTWTEVGPSAVFQAFAPLGHRTGTTFPTGTQTLNPTNQLGEVIWNSSPSVGNPIGWVCTAAGNPGTWTPLMNLGDSNIILPTGTGLWHETAGALDAAAFLGTADQLLGTNHAATDTSWFSAGGSLSLASGAFSVLAIDGSAGTAAIHCNDLIFDAAVAPLFGQAQASNTSTPQALAFQCQQPGASASSAAHGTPGGYSFPIPAPVSGGAEGFFTVSRVSGLTTYIGPYPSAPTAFAGIWVGIAPPANPNEFLFLSNGSGSTYLNTGASGTLHLVSGSTTTALADISATGWVFFSQTADFAGGTGVLSLLDASVPTTGNPTNGVVWESNAGSFRVRAKTTGTYDVAPTLAGTHNTQRNNFLKKPVNVRTTNTSATPALVYAMPADTHVSVIKVRYIGTDTTTIGSSVAAEVAATFYRSSGTCTQIGTTKTVWSNDAATPAVSIAPAGGGSGNAIVTITPASGDTIDWQLMIEIDEC